MIDHERLKEVLSYDPQTGIFKWIKKPSRRANRIRVGEIAGCEDRIHNTIMIGLDHKIYGAHRLAWLYVHGVLPDETDHINGNSSDNRIANLRACTHAQNMKNIKKRIDNLSGYKGVSFDKGTGKWCARVYADSKRIYLGLHETREQAREAYQHGALLYHGEFARLD